jgi:hypothetical protein
LVSLSTIAKHPAFNKILCCVLFFLLSYGASSQVFYSDKADYLRLKIEGNNLLNGFKDASPDTVIADAHEFFPRNFLGNLGLSSPDYFFRYNPSDLGFRFVPSIHANDKFSEGDVRYYRSKGPYAELSGIAGSKQLQAFKLLFTQTYREKLNITLKFNRYTSQGFYLRQQTFTNNFFLSSNFEDKKQRFSYHFYFLNNSNKNQENGGIKGDTLNDSLLNFNKNLLPVNLSAASRDNREYLLMFNPRLKLNAAADSLNNFKHFLQLKTKLGINTYKYRDAGVASDRFYQLIYLDTLRTLDSSHVLKLSNEISYGFFSANKNFGGSVGYKNEVNRVWQKNDSLFNNDVLVGDVFYRKSLKAADTSKAIFRTLESKFGAQYIFRGLNAGNYQLESRNEIQQKGKNTYKLFLNLMAGSRSADYIYNYWISNNFSWFNNGYKPQNTQQLQVGGSFNNKFDLSLLVQNIENYLFFDKLAQPGQLADGIQNLAVSASYRNVFFKHLGFSAQHTFQSSSTAFVAIPSNMTRLRLYYAGNLFKNNLQLNVGAQGEWFQSFYAYEYMPATQMFFLQEDRPTGNYPYLDLYLNARIRPVTIFIKVENALFPFAGAHYAFSPGYYQPERAFRLGITWVFFD